MEFHNTDKLPCKKGQSLVETAVMLPIILFIIYAMISVGIYIYDNSVVMLATNKALDTGVGILYREDMSEGEKITAIKEAAKNYMNIGIFVSEPEDGQGEEVFHTLSGNPGEYELKVVVKRKFNCGLPFMDEIFGENLMIKQESTYIYKGN